ncbi:MAG: HAD family phosphatase [Microscillaceae bacterium]|nr:HAD family phosphatase [Microscillaceae bacterium]
MPDFAVIFDMDGVMVDSNPYHKIALKSFCQRYGQDLSETQLRERIYGRSNKDWLRNVFGELTDAEVARYAQEKESLFREIYAPHIQLVPGLADFVQALHQAGVPMAIGTSAPPENVAFMFEKTGLAPLFQVIVDESQIAHGKPDPEIYLKASAALGLDPGRCLVFEDSLAGVEAALRAKCLVVGLSTTHTPEELQGTLWVMPDFVGLRVDKVAGLFVG